MNSDLTKKQEAMDLAADTAVFTDYLQKLGLPTDNIIASSKERRVVAMNLSNFLDNLSLEQKRDSRYLSKFVGATAIGLFDAALNYIWNEVVLNLRKKAIIYGIDLFYDAAVGGSNRASYKDETDLDGLKDSVLLNTCRKIELISDVVYKKLDHILTMRNEVAASHPNVESIGGFELLGWLQTCVKDVLQDKPSESAIRIKSLVENLKALQDIIDEPTAIRFRNELCNLSLPHVDNLLITLFGIFVAPNTSQVLRANVSLISPDIWQCADDAIKFRVGTIIDGYRTNFQQEKLNKGIEFLKLVNGRMYETLPARTIALEKLADRLNDVHDNWDNYHNEPSVMNEILQFFRESTDIPTEVLPKLVRVILRCRLGRGLSYREGVSPTGRILYDRFFKMLDDRGIIDCIIALFSPEINSKLTNAICQKHLLAVLSILQSISISSRLKESLDFLIADISNVNGAILSKKFRDITSSILKWN